MVSLLRKVKMLFVPIAVFAICLGLSSKVFAAKNLGGADCYKTWYINVNKPIDPNTLTSKNVKVFDDNNNEVSVSVNVYKNTSISVKPSGKGYSPGHTYYINLSSGIKSIYGDSLNLGEYAMNYFVVNQDYNADISDSTLEAAIRKAAKKQSGTLLQSDLDKITELNISDNYGANTINFSDITKLHNLGKVTLYNWKFTSLTNINNLAYYLRYVNSFYALNLSNNSIGSNISSVLNAFSNDYVTNINLSNTGISDVSYLTRLTNVNTVDLSNNKISNIFSLGTLSLRSVDLSNNALTNISPLTNDVGLTTLNLSNNNITDLSPIRNLYYLNTLNLSSNNKKASVGGYDLSPLSDLVNLQYLDLSNNYIKSIDSLENLDSITDLNLSLNGIQDISGIKNMQVLKNLNLANNYLISDISVIRNLENIVSIDLSNNKVRDLSPLSKQTNLLDLNLSYNDISDVTPLEDLVQLQKLKLNNNSITDVYPLIGLVNLNTLFISNNGKIDTTPLINLTSLSSKDF